MTEDLGAVHKCVVEPAVIAFISQEREVEIEYVAYAATPNTVGSGVKTGGQVEAGLRRSHRAR